MNTRRNTVTNMIFVGLTLYGSLLNYSSYAENSHTNEQQIKLRDVFLKSPLRAVFDLFLNNVLRYIPSADFWHMIDTINNRYYPVTDAAWYAHLIDHIHTIKPRLFVWNQMKALRFQKEVLSTQARSLINSSNPINGCLEIGNPGTYMQALQSFIPIKGSTYYLNGKQEYSDVIKAYSLNPWKKFKAYDHFIPLNNYDPIAESAIPSNSLELVICFKGLHHVPIEKLDAFVASIARVLKPGGILLLREHDVYDERIRAMVSAAHSVFNAVLGSTLEDEMNEYRNLQPLFYWINCLQKHGFGIGSQRYVQSDDPTLNTMLRATKIPHSYQEKMTSIRQQTQKHNGYVRDITQTMLTVPEWHDVDRAQAYGQFINHRPFYEYPYFENIYSYWDVYRKSWNLARTRRSWKYLLTSDYVLMNTFIGFMTTVEYAVKGIISWPLKKIIGGTEASTIQLLVKDMHDEIPSLDSRITILKHYDDVHIKLIKVPRYKEFCAIMKRIAKTKIEILEIAGQEEIQLKVRYQDEKKLLTCIEKTGAQKVYDWHVPTVPYTYAALLVRVKSLSKTINVLEAAGIELVYIHDF